MIRSSDKDNGDLKLKEEIETFHFVSISLLNRSC